MYIFFSILIVIASLLLIGVVLIQKSKGGGLAQDYSSGNQYLGYRKTTDFIEKATWGLAIFICVMSIFASFVVKTPGRQACSSTRSRSSTRRGSRKVIRPTKWWPGPTAVCCGVSPRNDCRGDA